ncbi:tetratricopeptide repeat protein [Erythrobacter sp. Alg231-14]|uniref:tetratricopeptide repeat protein n=1 Tax=Erythrobacter sp. Alg231-14 TaxID=1922225 RepID=UPI000D5549AB
MSSLKRSAARACLGGTALFATLPMAVGVNAETIQTRGVYAADASIPADVQLILVDRFRGDLGQDVELALTNLLDGVVIRGEHYFDLITPGALRTAQVEVEGQDGTFTTRPLVADAELRGAVRSEEFDRRIEPRIRRECVARDDDGDCTERREVRIPCRELTVRVDPRIVLTGMDGRQFYSYSSAQSQSERYCAEDGSLPSSLEMANGMVDRIVDEIRRDLAPVESVRDIRVMESRRDLRREDRGAFRDAVRATESDVKAACTGFLALEETNPDNVSVLFNIGLCFERNAELNDAADYYSRALSIDPGRDYPTRGMNRVNSRSRAEADLALRENL